MTGLIIAISNNNLSKVVASIPLWRKSKKWRFVTRNCTQISLVLRQIELILFYWAMRSF